ncbi:unnamed protein product, partial [Nesidiocoris tenuis]
QTIVGNVSTEGTTARMLCHSHRGQRVQFTLRSLPDWIVRRTVAIGTKAFIYACREWMAALNNS